MSSKYIVSLRRDSADPRGGAFDLRFWALYGGQAGKNLRLAQTADKAPPRGGGSALARRLRLDSVPGGSDLRGAPSRTLLRNMLPGGGKAAVVGAGTAPLA